MPVITVSRGSYSRGKEVAEKVAQRLGYECISRDVLIEASQEFNVPEVKLFHAIRDAPSFWDRFSYGRERYVAYIQAALLAHFKKDNVVYHGYAGHYFVKGVAHVLKVRILAEREDRIKVVMQREGISEDDAIRALDGIDEARRKWSLHLYGIDTNDPSLYDLVIHVKKLSTDDAADIICHAAGLAHFQATPESQQHMDDLALAARVKASLIDRHPRVNVAANQGAVYVGVEDATAAEQDAIRQTVAGIPGVRSVELKSQPSVTPD